MKNSRQTVLNPCYLMIRLHHSPIKPLDVMLLQRKSIKLIKHWQVFQFSRSV